jgi:endonuclease/exonuclease/phosphatase (EEP) superfamily protein YafD
MRGFRHLGKRIALLVGLGALCTVSVLWAEGLAVSEKAYVLSGNRDQVMVRAVAACNAEETWTDSHTPDSGKIDRSGFTIFSWNTQKGGDSRWYEDLRELAAEADIVLLQEAVLDRRFRAGLRQLDRDWLLAPAFQTATDDVGVMSVARVRADSYCAAREPEPFIRIPKMALVSRYPLADSVEQLLVVNVHVVNFTVALDAVRRQVDSIKEMIRDHRGPVVVAGDFNTWSTERTDLIEAEMASLGLQAVSFQPDHRVRFFERPVDGVYYRGLQVVDTTSYPVQSSDHNPLAVRFKMADDWRS